METPPVHECPKHHGPDLPVVSTDEPDVTDALYRPRLNQQLVLRFWRRQGKPQRVVLVAYGLLVIGTRTPFGEVFSRVSPQALPARPSTPPQGAAGVTTPEDLNARDHEGVRASTAPTH